MKTFNNNKASSQRNQLQGLLFRTFDDHMNLSRIKFCGLLSAPCAKCKTSASKNWLRFLLFRRQGIVTASYSRVIARYVLDHNLIAQLIFSLLPHDPPYTLALNRIDWKFGNTNINILMLAIVYKELLDRVLSDFYDVLRLA